MLQLEEGAVNELYEFKLRANSTLELFGNTYNPGEAVLIFENPRMTILKGFKNIVAARGGRQNRALVAWEDSAPPMFMISQGSLNPITLGLIMNARKLASAQTVIINKTDKLYLDRNNRVTLTETPINASSTFVYYGSSIDQMNKCSSNFYPDANIPSKNLEIVGANSTSIIVDYKYNANSQLTFTVGKHNLIGEFTAELKYYWRNSTADKQQTVYMVIPRVFCTSDFNLTGSQKGTITIGDLAFQVEAKENGDYYDMSIFSTDLDASV